MYVSPSRIDLPVLLGEKNYLPFFYVGSGPSACPDYFSIALHFQCAAAPENKGATKHVSSGWVVGSVKHASSGEH
jgi:hypothetical protein